jgi:hypothetical protein
MTVDDASTVRPVFIPEALSDRYGVKQPGWYGVTEGLYVMFGPYASEPDCARAIELASISK